MPQYAGFWRRVAATVIDSFIYTLLMGLIAGPAFVEAALLTQEGLLRTSIALLLTLVLWLKFLGTPGKLLLDCQVVDADSFEPMSLKQAALRYVAYLASILPLFLGFLWVAYDKRKQSFHDKLANTVVLYKAGIEADDESDKSLEQLIGELR
jgi:uncharacterized RDD family membrane protein YckC